MAEDCDNPIADSGVKKQVPWSDPAETCQVGIPDNTAEVVYVNGLPVFGLAPGIGSVDPGSGPGCPETPSPAVAFVTTAENVGTGEGLFKQLLNGVLQFLSIKAGDNVTVETVDDDIVISSTASGGVSSWNDLTDKPATFPPTLPIAESDVTDLEADLLTLSNGVAAVAAGLLTKAEDAITVTGGTGLTGGGDLTANRTISLDAASQASLALADSATQPGDLGTAAAADTTDFATAAQGALADTAIQPQLTENNPILFDTAGSADGKYSGLCISGTAGATLAFGDLCYFAVADSRWELADAGTESISGPVQLGFCVLAAASDGDPTRLLLIGTIRADTAFPTLTVGAPAYVSTTAGDIQVAAPSGTDEVVRVCGHARTADELWFNPSSDWMTLE